MKKMTLLEMVQNIASALDTDEVNSITDTIESLQIAEILKETYYEQFNNINVPELQGLVRLDSYSNTDSPNYLVIPSNVSKIKWLRYRNYRNSDHFQDLTYMDPEDFLERQLQYRSTGYHTVLTKDPVSGIEYYVESNQSPTYFTMFDDKYLAFNSFDLESEDTLQASNTLAYGTKAHDFLMEDDFIPMLDANLFPLLLAESKATAFLNLKQMAAPKEERRAQRQRIRMQNDQFKARQAQYSYWNRGNNFARHRR